MMPSQPSLSAPWPQRFPASAPLMAANWRMRASWNRSPRSSSGLISATKATPESASPACRTLHTAPTEEFFFVSSVSSGEINPASVASVSSVVGTPPLCPLWLDWLLVLFRLPNPVILLGDHAHWSASRHSVPQRLLPPEYWLRTSARLESRCPARRNSRAPRPQRLGQDHYDQAHQSSPHPERGRHSRGRPLSA